MLALLRSQRRRRRDNASDRLVQLRHPDEALNGVLELRSGCLGGVHRSGSQKALYIGAVESKTIDGLHCREDTASAQPLTSPTLDGALALAAQPRDGRARQLVAVGAPSPRRSLRVFEHAKLTPLG